jgi:hypothetical protein
MRELRLFVSHSTKYKDIATSLKLSLQALESNTMLDVRISEEMAGATDWRQWIDENVRSADIFVFLYPHAGMDMAWPSFELGRFYEKKRHVVSIKNTNIPKPPPQFEPYQAYDGDERGFTKFIHELFVRGIFTDGTPINFDIGNIGSEYYDRAGKVAKALAQKFTDARIRDHLYERRIELSVHYSDAKEFDAEQSTIEGNSDGLSLLGLTDTASIKWSIVRQSIGAAADWPRELERTMPFIARGTLPPALSPFRTEAGIFIPVIAKAESVDDVLRKLIVIFISTNVDLLRPLLDWSVPSGMPASFKFLFQVVRMMFHARWDILEPRYQEAKYRAPSPQRCIEIGASVVVDYDQMQRSADELGLSGLDKFYTAFHAELRGDVEACSEEWLQLMNELRSKPTDDVADLTRQIDALLRNNGKWFVIAGREFTLTVANFL